MYSQTAFPVINLAGTGRSIERHRRQAGLTVRDLQTYFGFEYPQAIYKWQHGECLPTVDNLLALARLLQVSMEDLLVYDDQEVAPFSAEFLPIFQQHFQPLSASFLNIPAGSVEIIGIPGIGDIPWAGGVLQQQMNLAIRVSPTDTAHLVQMPLFHTQHQVIFLIILPPHHTRPLP